MILEKCSEFCIIKIRSPEEAAADFCPSHQILMRVKMTLIRFLFSNGFRHHITTPISTTISGQYYYLI